MVALSHYDTLGVSAEASAEAIRVAYVALAKRFHPDQHPGATGREAARLRHAMAAVNEAYATLRDRERRAAYDRELARCVAGVGVERPSRPDECVLCGASPALDVHLAQVHAWVLGATVHTLEAPLCRSCGQSLGRAKQNRTLWAGWWGVLSFFRNLLVVVRNAWHLQRLWRLPVPSTPSDAVMVPLASPLDPGRAVWLRGGFVAVALVVSLGLLGAAFDSGDDATGPSTGSSIDDPAPGGSSRSSGGSGVGGSPVGWTVGSCVRGATWVTPVSCSSPNDGEIIAVVSSVDACPYAADAYVEDLGDVYCIDE